MLRHGLVYIYQIKMIDREGIVVFKSVNQACFAYCSKRCFVVYKIYNKYTECFEFDPAKSLANKNKHGIDFH